MHLCKLMGRRDCLNLYYSGDGVGETKADGAPMESNCYYCLGTPKTRKIAHASQWTGYTPKWCPLGRDK